MDNARQLQSLSDAELMRRLHDLAGRAQRLEADLVAHIGEVDARHLWAREAVSSMFRYCTERLHLSEAEAYMRIGVARAARKHPALLGYLRDGRIHLTGLSLLARHLTPENRDGLLARATHQPRRQIEDLIAELAPKPDVPASIRKAPRPEQLCSNRVPTSPQVILKEPQPDQATEGSPHPGSATPSPSRAPAPVSPPARPAVVTPLAPARYLVKFTASATLRDKLERLQALMRDADPDADLAATIEAAVTEKLERLETRRFAKTSRPRKSVADAKVTPTSRRIPAPIRRAVHERDGGRCRYVDARGRRCNERHGLEFHHRHAYGLGGDHSVDNVALYCKAHNALLAEQEYGREKVDRHRGRRSDRVSEARGVYLAGT